MRQRKNVSSPRTVNNMYTAVAAPTTTATTASHHRHSSSNNKVWPQPAPTASCSTAATSESELLVGGCDRFKQRKEDRVTLHSSHGAEILSLEGGGQVGNTKDDDGDGDNMATNHNSSNGESSLTPAQETAYAKHMLAKADQILQQVDESYIIQERGHSQRPMPAFRPEEISLGRELGQGGFGIVNEIRKFTLDAEEDIANAARHGVVNSGDNPQQDGVSSDDATAATTISESVALQKMTRVKEVSDLSNRSGHNDGSGRGSNNDHVHYDVLKARKLMERRCQRNGEARYALKRLHGDLSEFEQARGMIDMAVEAKYLSTVWHPNIIKMRGLAKGPLVDAGFFIILDRLFCTLDQRMNAWYKDNKKYSGSWCGFGKNKPALKQLLIDRMTVAYDLAAAFFYLHENRLVYRDIKPENIGFDVRGDVKVFDFGLCKSLSPKLKSKTSYGYRLTGRAGSLPYMAPEVARMQTYDTKCDVFSFAVLLWEFLALRQSFENYTPTKFMEKVVVAAERPAVPATWPPLTRLVIPEAWDDNPEKRPDMKRVAILIRADLNDMTTDERVLHRTNHMDDRSHHSMDLNSPSD